MNVNMGKTDRVIRAIVGLVLIVAPFLTSWAMFSNQWMMYVAVVVGFVLAGTALFGACPLYRIFGIDTHRA